MKKQNKNTEIGYKLVLQELEENPFRKFNLAFSLMVLIPFLIFVYLLVNRLFNFKILTGDIGVILFIAFFISLCGFYVGFSILRNIMYKIIFYAGQAKHSDQLKSTFVAMVSHELKSPLTSIKTNIYNVFAGFIGQVNEEQKKILELCQSTIERMTRLVNDLLDLHKIEAGMTDIKRRLCNLAEISERQLKELETLADRKSIRIIKNFSDRDLTVWADGDKLAQIINNLLSNAIKFTPNEGVITLKIYQQDRFARIECIDTGSGIPSEKIVKLFNKFERLDATKEGT
ncbi:MAG: HAMP domain-containing sensor histidine kinase, partial [Candidatus Omnitrophica bacterium]|nr:HAMP domain-containing sensor histidine kinase [Candidatus Omnitrophota bacterium]